jgi:hypothetical protein
MQAGSDTKNKTYIRRNPKSKDGSYLCFVKRPKTVCGSIERRSMAFDGDADIECGSVVLYVYVSQPYLNSSRPLSILHFSKYTLL